MTSVSSGEALNVVNILANTPGILVNAALNGFDYADPDPETGQGGFSEWPALLTFAEPGEQGGVRVVAGLLQNLLVNLPKTFADAIDNTPEVVPAAVTVQRIAEDVTVAPVAELTESVTEAPAVAGPAVETAKLVSTVGTVESEAPAAEVEAVKAEVEPAKAESVPAKAETAPAEASPAETEQAVVDSTPAASTGADAEGAVKSKTKVKVTDRIKAKISEAKEARQAKLKAAKEAKKAKAAAKAEAKAAKAAAKDTKSNTGSESKGSGESKGGSDSSE